MTSTLLNVYRCYQGHYMLQRGPVIETVRGTRVHWLGVLEPMSWIPPAAIASSTELEARAFALLTAAQFYDPNRGRFQMH
jgi:hypothetical protein